ncbi:MAG: hypothetical protein PF569_05400 [Candidatus Woesearchaeota archaeon]|jgi:hypothetical protein|nr:hypothetical protein [Candidatus Woesearchaeota archaeon]
MTIKRTSKADKLTEKLFTRTTSYAHEIHFLYEAAIKRNFKGYNFKNSKSEDLIKEYKNCHYQNTPSLANLFYTHALSLTQIPTESKIELIKEIENLEIFYDTKKEAEDKIKSVMISSKISLFEKYVKLHKEKKIERKNQLQITLPKEKLEKILLGQKLTQILNQKLEKDKIFEEELEYIYYTLGF